VASGQSRQTLRIGAAELRPKEPPTVVDRREHELLGVADRDRAQPEHVDHETLQKRRGSKEVTARL
jgi:hypothetical protein